MDSIQDWCENQAGRKVMAGMGAEEPGSRESRERAAHRDLESLLPGLEELIQQNFDGQLHRQELRVGMVVAGKWELTRRLGAGGFGLVFEAWHVDLEQKVAIKFLDARHNAPEVRQRFLEEARVMASLPSKHLVRVSDYGELSDGMPYFVMELVAGRSLRQLLHGALPISQALEITEGILLGLSEVHARGIVHSDIKPENVILDDTTGRVYLLDFGLAHTASMALGGIGGTPPYMAPELIEGLSRARMCSDVYAVGVVLYEMLTGRLPRGHVNMGLARMKRSLEKKPTIDSVRMHRKGVSIVLDEFLMVILARDPTTRPQSATPTLKRLQTIMRNRSLEVKRPGAVQPILKTIIAVVAGTTLPIAFALEVVGSSTGQATPEALNGLYTSESTGDDIDPRSKASTTTMETDVALDPTVGIAHASVEETGKRLSISSLDVVSQEDKAERIPKATAPIRDRSRGAQKMTRRRTALMQLSSTSRSLFCSGCDASLLFDDGRVEIERSNMSEPMEAKLIGSIQRDLIDALRGCAVHCDDQICEKIRCMGS